MASPTTIQDLPDDMLHEIFEHVFAEEPKQDELHVIYTFVPLGAHLALRCVCRRWRDIADWVRLSTAQLIFVDASELADVGAVRARHPAAFKTLYLSQPTDRHSTDASRLASSLFDGSADLRRALRYLMLKTCCLPSLLPAVASIASCTALTSLCLSWGAHKKERVPPSNMLAPLSALRMLDTLMYLHNFNDGKVLPTSALLAPLPALPDAPRLTRFGMQLMGNFVPVGSDAALGRLRQLDLWHRAPVQELLDAEDPFLLRTAFDAGTWQPSRLTGLQELFVSFEPVRDSRPPLRPSRTGSRPGSEWAPLAGQVTSLSLSIKSDGYKPPSTGIVAGLGALTALRSLLVEPDIENVRAGLIEPVSIDRLRAPHLTQLGCHCTYTPIGVARFPNLVTIGLVSVTPRPPLNLRSLVARSNVKTLHLGSRNESPDLVNLAELFVGGGGWPVLEDLLIIDMVLEWDTTGLAGAPTAVEFAERARQLLPALVRVVIDEPHGRGALPEPDARRRVGFVVACRRHVVPALLGLHAGGR